MITKESVFNDSPAISYDPGEFAVTSSCDQLLALNDIQSITKGFQRIFNDHSPAIQ